MVTTEHLVGEVGVKKHDCILPLPGGSFDLIYGHVLLKFIETDKQYNVLINAYQALKSGGVVVQVIDREEIGVEGKQFETGYWPVPLDKWREKLVQEKIMTELIELEYGVSLVLKKVNK